MRCSRYSLVGSFRSLLCILLVLSLSNAPLLRSANGAPLRADEDPRDREREACGHKDNEPEEARHFHEACRAGGSSTGIVKADFNGDGFADLAIGVPDEDLGGVVNGGAVNVIYGSANGLTATTTSIPAPQFWSLSILGLDGGARAGDRFGTALAAGDFNGDGFTDLAIGIPSRTPTQNGTSFPGAGAIAIIYGSPSGLTMSDPTRPRPQYFDILDLLDSDVPFLLTTNAHLGQALAWGNFNGIKVSGRDLADLAIGIPGLGLAGDLGHADVANAGGVWLLSGSPGATGGITLASNRFFLEKDTSASGQEGAGARYGESLAAGDFDGNGLTDLAIGAPGKNTGIFVNGSCAQACKPGAGAIEVISSLPGVVLGLDFGTTQVFNNTIINRAASVGDNFGLSLAAGDFNGDGKSDLAIGTPFRDIGTEVDAGDISILYGTANGLTTIGSQEFHAFEIGDLDQPGALFGYALAAGDFNGDGKTDLAIGVPLRNVLDVTAAGQVWVLFGSSPSGLSFQTRVPQGFNERSTNMPLTLVAGDHFGQSLSAWNFGKDEHTFNNITLKTADLAIGVPFRTVNGAAGAGAVVVVYGSVFQNGLIGTPIQLWSQNTAGVPCCSEAGDHFGASMY